MCTEWTGRNLWKCIAAGCHQYLCPLQVHWWLVYDKNQIVNNSLLFLIYWYENFDDIIRDKNISFHSKEDPLINKLFYDGTSPSVFILPLLQIYDKVIKWQEGKYQHISSQEKLLRQYGDNGGNRYIYQILKIYFSFYHLQRICMLCLH